MGTLRWPRSTRAAPTHERTPLAGVRRRASWLPSPVRRRGSITVAGQRRTCTGFPRPLPRPYRSRLVVGTPDPRPVAALVWLLWAVAAAASVQLAPNPLYVALIIAITAVVVEAHADDGPLAGACPVLLTAGFAFAALRVVLTVATTHGGAPEDVLFRLPQATLPSMLGGFTVGGTVEGPVMARAA